MAETKPEVTEIAKPEVKKEVKKKIEKKYKVPDLGETSAKCIFKDLEGMEEQIAVLSYLPYKSLINVAKTSKFAFQFIMDRPTRKLILSWKPAKEDDTKIANYINDYINKKAAEAK